MKSMASEVGRKPPLARHGKGLGTVVAVQVLSEVTTASAALAWLAAETRARLMVRGDLSVVWHNDAAGALLEPRTGVAIDQGSLSCTAASTARLLLDYLAGLGPKLKTLTVPRDDADARLLLRGRLVESQPEPLYGLELATDDGESPVEYRDIDTIFALTRAEHRVVLGMLSGRQATALADHLGVSIDTVRTHVRRIYGKLGVGSREEMFALLGPYRIA